MVNNNNPFKPFLDKLPKPFKNKYFLVLVAVLAWMVFFDRHDFVTQWQLQQSVNRLEEDKKYYSVEIEKAKQQRLERKDYEEKFARERYFMKKKGEDVFIIVEE